MNTKKISELELLSVIPADGSVLIESGGAAKRIPASAVGAQSDWNQNDETASDYIKNRTHWIEFEWFDVVEPTVIDITQPVPNYNNSYESYYALRGSKEHLPNSAFIVGDRYEILWNDQSYIAIVPNSIPNNPIFYVDGIKHVVVCSTVGNDTFLNVRREGSPITGVTFGFRHAVERITTIDPKFLPEPEPVSWNDLTDKPFGDNADGTVKTIDLKYLPEEAVVSSWNDLTDKPFGAVAGDVVIENLSVYIADEGTAAVLGESLVDTYIEAGKSYIVRWNGVDYLCDAFTGEVEEGVFVVALGNTILLTEEDNGIPFLITFFDEQTTAAMGACAYIMFFDGSESIELSIYKPVIHPIDPKYLPMDDIFNEMVKRLPSAEGGSY